jgi:hypothetical protein
VRLRVHSRPDREAEVVLAPMLGEGTARLGDAHLLGA